MLHVIIIEDEIPAMDMISQMLAELNHEVIIQAKLRSVKEGIEYFNNDSSVADIIFSDVQLADGLSFEIFKDARIKTPVIFTTCYDQFMLPAFENNGIDYLLKPIEKTDLQKALWKYENLQNHFVQHTQENSIARILNILNGNGRSRILGKKGQEHALIKLEDIVLFYTENKLVFVTDRFSKKYLLDKTLSELEQELDPQLFFRANRQYIINLNYVKGFKPFERVKLLVDLNIQQINHSVIVSQETAQAFRKWIRSA